MHICTLGCSDMFRSTYLHCRLLGKRVYTLNLRIFYKQHFSFWNIFFIDTNTQYYTITAPIGWFPETACWSSTGWSERATSLPFTCRISRICFSELAKLFRTNQKEVTQSFYCRIYHFSKCTIGYHNHRNSNRRPLNVMIKFNGKLGQISFMREHRSKGIDECHCGKMPLYLWHFQTGLQHEKKYWVTTECREVLSAMFNPNEKNHSPQ